MSEKQNAKANDENVSNVSLKTEDAELIESVNFGATHDKLNLKRIFSWVLSGTILVFFIIVWLIQFSQNIFFKAQTRASINSEYADINELKAADEEMLNSYGVVDLDKGIYRIPINEAIKKIAKD